MLRAVKVEPREIQLDNKIFMLVGREIRGIQVLSKTVRETLDFGRIGTRNEMIVDVRGNLRLPSRKSLCGLLVNDKLAMINA